MLRIFEDYSKNLEKMTYFVHKIALKTEIFQGSSKNRPFYTSEVFSRVALKPLNFEAETSKSFSPEVFLRVALEKLFLLRDF